MKQTDFEKYIQLRYIEEALAFCPTDDTYTLEREEEYFYVFRWEKTKSGVYVNKQNVQNLTIQRTTVVTDDEISYTLNKYNDA